LLAFTYCAQPGDILARLAGAAFDAIILDDSADGPKRTRALVSLLHDHSESGQLPILVFTSTEDTQRRVRGLGGGQCRHRRCIAGSS
jgi:DNA-binding response OmpR family regulator